MTTDSDAVTKIREHIERHKHREQAFFSIAGLAAVLAELDALKNQKFQPTHYFTETGKAYHLVGPGQVKMARGDGWRAAHFYVNEDGERFATGPERWNERFEEIF